MTIAHHSIDAIRHVGVKFPSNDLDLGGETYYKNLNLRLKNLSEEVKDHEKYVLDASDLIQFVSKNPDKAWLIGDMINSCHDECLPQKLTTEFEKVNIDLFIFTGEELFMLAKERYNDPCNKGFLRICDEAIRRVISCPEDLILAQIVDEICTDENTKHLVIKNYQDALSIHLLEETQKIKFRY